MSLTQTTTNSPAAEGEADPKNDAGKSIHYEFVAMLFALAVAEVALRATAIVEAHSTFGKTVVDLAPGYTHLLLATIVIAASWVDGGAPSTVAATRGPYSDGILLSC